MILIDATWIASVDYRLPTTDDGEGRLQCCTCIHLPIRSSWNRLLKRAINHNTSFIIIVFRIGRAEGGRFHDLICMTSTVWRGGFGYDPENWDVHEDVLIERAPTKVKDQSINHFLHHGLVEFYDPAVAVVV